MELGKYLNEKHNNRFDQTQAKRYLETTIRTQVPLDQSIENQVLEYPLGNITLRNVFRLWECKKESKNVLKP